MKKKASCLAMYRPYLLNRVPRVAAEKSYLPGHGKKYDGYTDVREDHAHPNLFAQRIQKAEHTGFLFDGLLDHNTDSQRHERFTEVDHSFTFRRDRHRGDGNVCFLKIHHNR